MPNEIKCPRCGFVFQVAENDYAEIVKQIRDKEFDHEVSQREELYKNKNLLDVQAAQNKTREDYEKKLRDEENKYHELELKLKDLEAKVSASENEKTIALNAQKLELNEHIQKLKSDLIVKDEESKTNLDALKKTYEAQLKGKDEEIAFYKDFKAKESTKAIGESLEVYCHNLYESRLRPVLPTAYFEKDNDVVEGSKGDFIFRDYKDGVEYVSIMFEMKNEADTTSTKKTNESFLPELDKDRRLKKCDYAVLVSMLEPDSELYNQGIIDVSHRFDKMYVIRPQFLIPMITLLRSAALKNADMRYELEVARNEQIDITNFEKRLFEFKDDFTKNVGNAKKKFDDAIKEINKSITELEKVRDALLSSEKQLEIANGKVEGITIRKLTYNNPTMKKKLEDAKEE